MVSEMKVTKPSLEEFRDKLFRCIHCRACRFAWSDFPDKSGFEGKTQDGENRVWEGMLEGCPSGKYFGWEAHYNSGRMWIARAVLQGELDINDPKVAEALRDEVFKCTTCANCSVQCANNLPSFEITEALRAEVLKHVEPLPKHKAMGNSVKEKWDPYGEPPEKRVDWLKKIAPEVIDKQADTAYYVGCTIGLRTTHIGEATVKLLKKLGVDFTVLSQEACCGSPMIRTGQLEIASKTMQKNIQIYREKGVKRILFSCAGCYKTFCNDYPKEAFKGIELMHVLEFVYNLVKAKAVKFKEYKKIVTWHDPCHLIRHQTMEMRHGKAYQLVKRKIEAEEEEWMDMPRVILKAIPGVDFREMYRIKDNAWCCGAGGGIKAQYPDFAIATAEERIKEAETTGAQVIATNCGFCLYNLRDGAKSLATKRGKPSQVEVIELIELLADIIEPLPAAADIVKVGGIAAIKAKAAEAKKAAEAAKGAKPGAKPAAKPAGKPAKK